MRMLSIMLESVLLTAGRPTPASGEQMQRGEAIVLSSPAIAAWRAAGERWKAWTSRLVSAPLQTGNKKGDHFHMLSCYAPTQAASREVKDANTDSYPPQMNPDEPYILLGGLIARIGSCDGHNDPLSRGRGHHGHGIANDAGTELLSFLSMYEATVCNMV